MEMPPPFGPHSFDNLKHYLSGVIASLPEPPKAVLVISAHWEEVVPTVSTSAAPGMIYDYYGFPEHTYQLQYPAPGSPELAKHIQALLQQAGIDAASDERRGFDHGVFVPMLIIDPQARIPVVMLSLDKSLDPARHIAIGEALAPLRDEGVLILASGNSYHNLRLVFDDNPHESVSFDEWLNETITLTDPEARKERLSHWRDAPGGVESHPREEHLIPLMVAVGAAGSDPGNATFREQIGGKAYTCFSFNHAS